jgi:hypothetical protein
LIGNGEYRKDREMHFRAKILIPCCVTLAAWMMQARNARANHPSDSWGAAPCCKVCKLVCEKKKVPAVGYGYKYDTICIQGPSRRGCKHCDMTCCARDDLNGCNPKIEFCWYDWFACGCAKPREIRLLTKYQAEKELPSYHWEVVDGACCDCVSQTGTTMKDGTIYKVAPAEAALGDVLAVSDEEWQQISPQLMPAPEVTPVPDISPVQVAEQSAPVVEPAEPSVPEQKEISITERIQGVFRR